MFFLPLAKISTLDSAQRVVVVKNQLFEWDPFAPAPDADITEDAPVILACHSGNAVGYSELTFPFIGVCQ